MRRLGIPCAVSLVLLTLSLFTVAPAAALTSGANARLITSFPGRQVAVTLSDAGVIGSASHVSADLALAATEPTADIEVTYNGFSPAAQSAFEAAVDIWERNVVSTQVIHVDASWTPLEEPLLGHAGPDGFYLMTDDYVYPAALAEAICGCEGPNYPVEISAEFNSAYADWYFGTDDNPPADEVDFETVVLHELGHGLGYLSSFDVTGSVGSWGFTVGDVTYPLRYDANEWSAAAGGNQLISGYSNPSADLKAQLTDGSVYFGGTQTVVALGGRAKLFAPNPWQPGSSNSHFDEIAFATGTVNALMTPSLEPGESLHDPGPAMRAVLQDIGWEIASTPLPTLSIDDQTVSESAGNAVFNVSLSASSDQTVSVDYATANDSATAPADYTSTSGTLTFDPGDTAKTISVPIIDDDLVESSETFTVDLDNPVNATIDDGEGLGTIDDNDAPAGPANDNFDAAAPISGASGTTTGSNVGATGEAGESPITSGSNPIESVWWRWTAPASGNVSFNTCGSSFDTTLGVYTGPSVDSLAQVATNDDDPTNTCGLRSRVTFAAVAGTTYAIAVDGYAAQTGDISLSWASAADNTPPDVDDPTGLIVAPQQVGTTMLVHLSWSASDVSGISSYELQQKIGRKAWRSVTLPASTTTEIDLALKPGKKYHFRVRATDGADNLSAWVTTSTTQLRVVQEKGTRIAYTGSWKRKGMSGAWGGYVMKATAASARALFTFNGTNAVLVATAGPARGIADMYLDGTKVATVDFYSATVHKKYVAWASDTPLAPGTHTLEVRVTGTRNARSSNSRIDVDAFVSWP